MLDRISWCSTSATGPAFALVSVVVVVVVRHDHSHFDIRERRLASDIEDLGARPYLGGCLTGVVVVIVCGSIVSVCGLDWTQGISDDSFEFPNCRDSQLRQ